MSASAPTGLRILELFSGIGGCAAAVAAESPAAVPTGAAESPAAVPTVAAESPAAVPTGAAAAAVVAAVDQDTLANAVYRHLFGHDPVPMNLDRAAPEWFARFAADLWWMSPPCQPHTVRGRRRDLDDPRARSFVQVVRALGALGPRFVALENVPGFAGSRAHGQLREVLDRRGYAVREAILCPTALGVPMRRRRFFLLAAAPGEALPPQPAAGLPTPGAPDTPEAPSGVRAAPDQPAEPPLQPLSTFLLPDPPPELQVDPDLVTRYAEVMSVVDADDPAAVTDCFTSAYGRTPLYAGSYLRQGGRVRRFAPEEIARLMGFPGGFSFPAGLTLRQRWSLVGNVVAVSAVRAVLGPLLR